jgi:hypothetical protein
LVASGNNFDDTSIVATMFYEAFEEMMKFATKLIVLRDHRTATVTARA